MVPKDWLKFKFGDIAQIANGQVPPMAEPYLYYRHIGPENIVSDTGQIINLKTAAELGLRSGKYVFDNEAIVYSKIRPNLNKVCRPDFIGLCSADAYPVWPKKDKLTKDFLFYHMLSPDFVRQTTAVSMRTGLPKINRQDLCSLKVIFPSSIKEQIKITSILDCWAVANELTLKLLNAKKKIKQGLMQQLLTGKRRFKEFIKSAATRETPFGNIPLDWKYPLMREIAEEVSQRNSNGKEITVLSCTKYDGLVSSQEYFGKRVFSKDTSDYKIVKRSQFAYATNHIEEGSIGLLENFEEGLVSPMYTVFKTRPDVHPPFLFKLFKTELYRHIFEVNTSASVDRRGSLRWKQFSSIHVPLPSFGEQVKISDYIELHDKEISLRQKQLELLNSQKTGLMQKLLTGQIRVKV